MNRDTKTTLLAILYVVGGLAAFLAAMIYVAAHVHEPAGADWTKFFVGLLAGLGALFAFVGAVNLPKRAR